MRKYEAILKIAQYGNLTRAAQELGYVQSNLSHMVQRLENDLQIKIFHRDRQGVTLTRAGQELIDIMHRIELLEASLVTTALSHRTSILRVGTFPSVSVHWLPQILDLFYQKFPSTTVHLTSYDRYLDMDNSVRKADTDCCFYAGDYHAGLDFFPLCRDSYYAVVSTDHELSQQSSLSIADLRDYPFIMPGEGIHCSIKNAPQLLPFPPKLTTTSQEDLSVLYLVEKNLGVSILPGLSVKTGLTNVCAIPLVDIPAREVGILCKPYGEISDVSKYFIQMAKEVASSWQEGQSTPLPTTISLLNTSV